MTKMDSDIELLSGMPSANIGVLLRGFEASPEIVFVKDLEHRWVAMNDAFCRVMQRSRAELLGMSDPFVFPPERAARNWQVDDEVIATGQPSIAENVVDRPDGSQIIVWTRKYPIRNMAGEIDGLFCMTTEITELSQRLRAAERMKTQLEEQKHLIELQKLIIRDLAMPVLEIEDGLLLAPLVGGIDAERAATLTQTLLDAVVRHHARMLILDVTGLPSMDGESIAHIMRALAAVALLGSRATIVGIGAAAARALVEEGAALDGIRTAATLKQGIALGRQHLKLSKMR